MTAFCAVIAQNAIVGSDVIFRHKLNDLRRGANPDVRVWKRPGPCSASAIRSQLPVATVAGGDMTYNITAWSRRRGLTESGYSLPGDALGDCAFYSSTSRRMNRAIIGVGDSWILHNGFTKKCLFIKIRPTLYKYCRLLKIHHLQRSGWQHLHALHSRSCLHSLSHVLANRLRFGPDG